MVPTDLSAPKTALRHPQEHTAWARPSLSSTIVVRCSIVVAAPVPLALTVLPRFCAGSAALGRWARGPDWAPVDPRRRTGQPSRWSERRTVPVAGCERSSGRGRYGDGLAPSPMKVTGGETWEERPHLRRVSRPAGRRPQSPVRAGSQHPGAGRDHWPVPTVSCIRCSRKLTCPCVVVGAPDGLDRADHREQDPPNSAAPLRSPG